MGPTASGKTDLAIALQDHFPVELINVDSAQVYRQLDIGSAKPDRATLEKAPHHLIDIRDPLEAYSAADFLADATRVMADITARGNIPLLVGGTMLYFKVLLEGLSKMPEANPEIRNQIQQQADSEGWPAVYKQLQAVDPDTAAGCTPTIPSAFSVRWKSIWLAVYPCRHCDLKKILAVFRKNMRSNNWP